ncbi:hypothetical protein VB740_12125 [Nostoc sp. UHCC 0251]|nr:hypothetical protein [Nostoc sp. UHCC 0251]MEA5623691.1 hypothetical protein [Nostoc sp. UHCC 0251]
MPISLTGETQVVPVKAEINNLGGVLKPGMFADLEVLTNQTSSAILAIPSAAVVEANNKKVVYIQNGNAYQPVEVSLGQTSGDMVEVKTGLFEGDMIVTQRAPQLYAQSLRGGGKAGEQGSRGAEEQGAGEKEVTANSSLPWWVGLGGGTALGIVGFIGGTYWANRRTQSRLKPETPIINHNSQSSAPPQ